MESKIWFSVQSQRFDCDKRIEIKYSVRVNGKI